MPSVANIPTIHILLVEDCPEDRTVFIYLLGQSETTKYIVSEASSGEEGLEIHAASPADCILLDYNLPDINGLEFVAELTESEGTLIPPVVMLTGASDEVLAAKALRLGVVDYLVKGQVDVGLLELSIRNAIKHKRVRQELDDYAQDIQLAKALLTVRAEKLAEVNARLTASEERLRELDAQKNKFFSIISHDLRNPAIGMFQMSEMIVKAFDDLSKEELRELSLRLHDSSSHLYALLENLLQWSRLQMDELKHYPVMVDIAQLAEKNRSLLAQQAIIKEIELLPIEAEGTVYVDEEMLNFVIRNLLTNALKFTLPGGQIKVRSKPLRSHLELSISDTGIGMSKTDMGNLFRIDATYTRKGTADERGTGLGLNLCKEFVERNRGTVRLESEEGKGTTVFVKLPTSSGPVS